MTTTNLVSVRVLRSALRRQWTEADIMHALRFSLAYVVQNDGMTMHLGPARSGHIIEVGTVERDDQTVVAQRMSIRPTYLRYLPR